jgi:restriction endonuclease S subunit
MAEPYLTSPARWTQTTLESRPDLGFIDKADSGGTPATVDPDLWDGDIPWLTPKEITGLENNIFVSRTERNISKLGLETSAAKLLPVGTVLLTKRAPVGAVAINVVPMATNQGFLNFQCGPRLRPMYLAFWLAANKPYLDLVANGSTYPELYKNDLFEFQIAVPTLEEQDEILKAMAAVQLVIALASSLEQSVLSASEIVNLQKQNRRLREIRNALLPLLISGQLPTSHVEKALARTI